jgi:hypothetical protein
MNQDLPVAITISTGLNIVLFILLVAIFATLLNIVFRQSYNFIFLLGQRPTLWIFAVGILGLAWMAIGLVLPGRFNLTSLTAGIVFFTNLPKFRVSKQDDAERGYGFSGDVFMHITKIVDACH